MRRLHRVGALIALLVCARPFVASAQTCSGCIFLDCHTPAISAPNHLWGELEPGDTGVLPLGRDSSHLADYGNPEYIPRWTSVDPVEDASGKWLFAVTNMRVQAWSLNANPDLPSSVADLGLSQTGLQGIVDAHTATVFTTVRAAPNNSNQIAVGGVSNVGVGVFNTTNKVAPALRYQDGGKDVNEVYTARFGGRDYLFAARRARWRRRARLRYDADRRARLVLRRDHSHTSCAAPCTSARSARPRCCARAAFPAPATTSPSPRGLFQAAGGIYIYNVSTPADSAPGDEPASRGPESSTSRCGSRARATTSR